MIMYVATGDTYTYRRSFSSAGWDWNGSNWTTTQGNAVAQCRTFRGVKIIESEVPVLAERVQGDFETKTAPWDHQRTGYALIADNDALMLNWEMGTGKTKPVVDWICNNMPGSVLIGCPKAVVDVWIGEFAVHGLNPPKLMPLNFGSTEKNHKHLTKAIEAGQPFVCVVNYEALWRSKLGDLIVGRRWDLVVADEIQKLKAAGSKVSRFFARLRPRCAKRIGLTGTVMHNSPLDTYAQYRFLDPSVFGNSFTRFRSRYAVMGHFAGQVVSFKNLDDMSERMARLTHRVEKARVLDLPPFTHQRIDLDLPPETMRVYRQMDQEFVAQIKSGEVTASNALSRLLRLQQITSGFLPIVQEPDPENIDALGRVVPHFDNGSNVERLDNTKEDAVVSILGDLPTDEPIAVFCRFREDLRAVWRAAGRVKRKCHFLMGGKNELADWQACEGGEILACQLQSGGIGVNLTRSCYTVCFSLGFSLGDFDQMLAREHRGGQTRSVTYIHLVARGTVDVKVYAALRAKQKVVDYCIEHMGDASSSNP